MADTGTISDAVDGTNPPTAADAAVATEPSTPNDRNAQWRSRIAKSRQHRRDLITEWSTNVDYRRGKQFDTDSDKDRIAITIDWSATKAKQAQLFSQVPEVRLKPKNPAYKDSVPVFAKKLNEQLGLSRVGVAMDEVLPDCINAAGVGAVMVSYEARMESATVPAVPAEQVAALKSAGQEVPMRSVQRPKSQRFPIRRVSPGDLLWPVDFTGSDFEDSPWIGRSGRAPWSDAKHLFDLKDEDKPKVTGQDQRTTQDMLSSGGDDKTRYREVDMVNFEEIFYWRYLFHPEETSYEAIQRLVFVHGKDEPVVDEPWKGQVVLEDGTVAGSCKRPIQVLTLTYLSDECIPPSDTAMGRPQVDELIRSRSLVLAQREHSLPIRWFDVNRVDIGVQDSLQRGRIQGLIPMNGDGNRAIGEVVRADRAREDFEFDRIAKSDLMQTWQVGPDQMVGGGGGSNSATESQIKQANFATRIGYERARVVRFFISIVEVLAGLVALYGKFTQEEEQAFGDGWNRQAMANYYVYNVYADSTILLDAQQRIDRLMAYLNMVAKSGYIDVEPVIREITELSGVDPSVVRKPEPKSPEPMNISLRVTGKDDLDDPIVIALLMKSGQAPTPDELAAAKKMLQEAHQPLPPPEPTPPGPPAPGMPPPPLMPGAAPGPSQRPGLPDAHPEWNTVNRIEKRANDGGLA